MKTNKYIIILVCMLCCILVPSCEIHEFPAPKPKEMQFVLNLKYDTELPLYKVVEYNDDAVTKSAGQEYDVRYVVNVYDAVDEDSREVIKSFVFTKDEISELDNSVTLMLLKGNYRFIVWTDYVLQGSVEDLHYDTSRFEYLSLACDEHHGSDDMRDAFTGSVTAEVSAEQTQVDVQMSRPMAKFNFISTDLQDFVARVKMNASNPTKSVEVGDYKVIFRYNGFMPCAYNQHTSKPTDSATGVFFESSITQLNDAEAEMGFDYVFTNGSETVVSVSVEVYDLDGKMLSRSKAFDVPLMRSKLTTVKARFLTSDASGGVVVDPGYNGDHNLVN